VGVASIGALQRLDRLRLAAEGFHDASEVQRRLRHGTERYVRVEHILIGDGGQAVIGNVKTRDGDAEGPSPK